MPCPEKSALHLQGEEKAAWCGEAEAPQQFKRGCRSSQRWEDGPKPWLLTPEMAVSPLGLNGGELLLRPSKILQ